jgi:hypothetical protein
MVALFLYGFVVSLYMVCSTLGSTPETAPDTPFEGKLSKEGVY